MISGGLCLIASILVLRIHRRGAVPSVAATAA
jgi:hypothetical protein